MQTSPLPPAYIPWLVAALAVVLTPITVLFGADILTAAIVWLIEWALMFFFAFLMRSK